MTHEPLSKEDVQEIIDSAIDYKVKEYFRMNRPGFEIASNVETQAHGLAEFQLNTDLQQGIHFIIRLMYLKKLCFYQNLLGHYQILM